MLIKKIKYAIYVFMYCVKNVYFLFISSKKIIGINQSLFLITKFFCNYILTILVLNFKYKYLKNKFKSDIIKNNKFSNDWFSNNIPVWKHVFLAKSRKIKNILEIGSFEGMSAIFFLSHFQESRIDCVETFEGSDEHSVLNFLQVKNNFNFNIKSYEQRCNLYKMTSDNFFNQYKNKDTFYDLIYIDGSHFGEQVYRDAVNSFEMLNINGIIIFDDFLRKYYKKDNENVIGGVCNFIKKYDKKIKIIFVGYQIFIKKNNY